MSGTVSAGVAILGSGFFAREGAHLPALKALGPLAPSLKAVYSLAEKRARALAQEALALLNFKPDVYYDGNDADDLSPTNKNTLDALIERSDISTVIIALPIAMQPVIVLRALAAGKHVISEKPVAPDVASGVELITTYEREYKPKGLIWRVAEDVEAEPGYAIAAQAIRSGKIGKVIFFSLRGVNCVDRESLWYKTTWRAVPEHKGGFLLDGGVHSAAALRVVLPSPLDFLSGFASLNAEWLAPHDTISAIIKSADGSHGTFELSFAAPTESRSSVDNGMIVTGTDGYITVIQTEIKDPIMGEEKSVLRIVIRSVSRREGEVESSEKEDVIDEPVRGVEIELASFFAFALEGKDDGLGDPRGALRDVAVIEAALKSNGELIDLEKLLVT